MTQKTLEYDVKKVNFKENVVLALVIASIIGLGKCAAVAQDDLLILQKDVTTQSDETKVVNQDIKEIKEDINDLKITNEGFSTNQQHFVTEIEAIRASQIETVRLLNELLLSNAKAGNSGE